MLGGAWLAITILLVLAAAMLRQTPLLLIALLFFLASGVARLWSNHALTRVDYARKLSTARAFFGETIMVEISIANRKMLPLPWVRIEDEVPEDLTFLKGKVSGSYKPSRAILSNVLSLGWYHQLTRRYPVQCLRRGLFTFGPVEIQAGDLFGFFRSSRVDEKVDRLLVYPRIVPLEALGIPSRHPFGDLRVRRHLHEDPVQAATVRDYAHGDPMKRIHWKATARVGRMQTRVFERTTAVDLALFLDARTVEAPTWGRVEQLIETAVITAASIAKHSADQGFRVGLYVNESYRYSDRMIKLPPSDHPEQLQRVLEALAQIQGLPFFGLDEVILREARVLPWTATLAVITAIPSQDLLGSLARFRRAGRRTALIVVGGQAPMAAMDGMPVYQVSDEVYWRELESLRLRQERNGGPG